MGEHCMKQARSNSGQYRGVEISNYLEPWSVKRIDMEQWRQTGNEISNNNISTMYSIDPEDIEKAENLSGRNSGHAVSV